MSNEKQRIIAVDFDGTLVENAYPEIGKPIQTVIDAVKEEKMRGSKLILWTCRVDEYLEDAIEFCKEQGIIFDAINDNVPEIIESYGSNQRKIFATEYWDDRAINISEIILSNLCFPETLNKNEKELDIETTDVVRCTVRQKLYTLKEIFIGLIFGVIDFIKNDMAFYKKSNMETWAEREIELAKKFERGDAPESEWDYGCACYDSAYRAYKSLRKDGHSGMSIGITKYILNRLIDHKPLRPIEDIPDMWGDVVDRRDDKVVYQCKRMGSLFKTVHSDGRIEYSDNDYAYCVDIRSGSTYSSGWVNKIIREMFPITMPYMPASEPIKVYCEELLTDRKNGDFDTKVIWHCIKPNGERIDINRFFKESKNGWIEISKEEYEKRKEIEAARIEKESKSTTKNDIASQKLQTI